MAGLSPLNPPVQVLVFLTRQQPTRPRHHLPRPRQKLLSIKQKRNVDIIKSQIKAVMYHE